MSLVVYYRPGKFKQWMLEVVKLLKEAIALSDDDISYYSEHKTSRTNWLPSYLVKNDSFYFKKIGIDYDEIILRCRLLRNVDEKKAIFEVNKYFYIWEQVLSIENPKAILSITVDSYILDILERVSLKKGIVFLGLTGLFLNGYFRISLRGEYYSERIVDDVEVDQTHNMLYTESYIPKFLFRKNDLINFLKRWSLVKIKKIVLSLRLLRDPFNYDYRTVVHEYCADAYRLSNYYTSFNMVSTDELEKSKICYIPLHAFPEATVEYWTHNKDLIDYYTAVYALLENLEREKIFDYIIVKEHPGAIGTRCRAVYNKIKSYKNVRLLDASTSSKKLLLNSNCVISWTGTVCFEAALYGIPSFLLGDPFFHMTKYMNKCESLADLILKLRQSNFVSGCSNEYERKDLIRYVLMATLPGTFLQVGFQKEANMALVATSIQKALTNRNVEL